MRLSALVGTFGMSGANFLLAFAIQRFSAAADFGLYALLQVMLQFGLNISNAIFCSPVIVALDGEEHERKLQSFFKANTIYCLAGASLIAGATFISTQAIGISLAAMLMCVLSWTRWFVRSVELALHNYVDPARADIIYAAAVGVAACWLLFNRVDNVELALWIQAAGSLAGFLTLRGSATVMFADFWNVNLQHFLASFRMHGRWSLFGVINIEAAANAHAWIVGLVLGPAALAPIAAMVLFFRPVLIVLQALTHYERPRMAQAIRDGRQKDLQRQKSLFTGVSMLCWLLTGLGVAGILIWAPSLVGNGRYPIESLWAITGVLSATYLARILRGGEGAALQAGGYFRRLALLTLFPAPLAIVGVTTAAFVSPSSAWSLIIGVLVGELVVCVKTRREYHELLIAGSGST